MESESGNYQNLGAAVVIEEGRFHTIIIGEGKKSQGLIKLLVYLLSIFFLFKYLYEHFFSDFFRESMVDLWRAKFCQTMQGHM